MGPRDQVQAGRSCPALAGGRLDRLWPASREWRHRRFVVWTWNVTSDRAGRAELNAPQDTVIVAWAATWEEASVRNGVTTAPSWMPVRSARRSPSRDDTAELMRMLERGAQDAADTGEQRTISWQRAELAIEPALGTGGRWSSESRHRTAGLESPARSSRRPSKQTRAAAGSASTSSTDHGYSHRGHGPASAQRSTGSPDRCSRSWRTSPVSTA